MGFIKQEDVTKDQIADQRTRYVAHTDHLMTAVIDFNDGPATQADPPHSHPHEQVTYVVTGELIFTVGHDSQHLVPGDMVTVPPNAPHTVQILTGHARVVDAFTPIREEFLK